MVVEVSRRECLRLILATGATLLAACAPRRSTPFTAAPGAFPAARLRLSVALRDHIQHIVIFLQENHTFDSLFAHFPGADGEFAGQPCPDALSFDPPHQHRAALTPGGATTVEARCSYDEVSAPNYWRLAREFVLCDRFFSEVRGPSQPNYLMLLAAQSPIVDTPFPTVMCPDFCLDIPTIADRLDAARLTWRDYAGLFTDIKALAGRSEVTLFDEAAFFRDAAAGTLPNVAWLNSGFLKALAGRSEVTLFDEAAFFRDAAAGTLPNVAWLNSGFLKDNDNKSGHPPGQLCRAENFAVEVVKAIMTSPQWNSVALFLVWDDWGGFYDHVEPPTVENWTDGTPFRYGFRVPCLVIGPYARSGYVSHQVYSLVSLLRFIETVFDLEPLTPRDAQSSDLLDCFDFARTPHPPIELTPRICPR